MKLKDYCLDMIISNNLTIYGYVNNFIEIYINNNLTKTIFCPEKCIIYSMEIYETNDTIIIASGTVFRKIVLWTLSKQEDFKVTFF
jgi:hypothetical protein